MASVPKDKTSAGNGQFLNTSMGVSSIKAFAMPIIIGIVIGTYSSICVAGTVWATWKDSAVKAKANRK